MTVAESTLVEIWEPNQFQLPPTLHQELGPPRWGSLPPYSLLGSHFKCSPQVAPQ